MKKSRRMEEVVLQTAVRWLKEFRLMVHASSVLTIIEEGIEAENVGLISVHRSKKY